MTMVQSEKYITARQTAADQYRIDYAAYIAAQKTMSKSLQELEKQLSYTSMDDYRKGALISALENGFKVEINE